VRTSPTLRRRRLAAELRRLRTNSDLTADEAAKKVGISKSTISRIENGQVTATPSVVASLLRLYEVDEADIEPLLQIARDARKRGWWQRYADAIPEWFDTYVGLESEAAEVCEYHSGLVSGLLQTPDYTRAVIRAEHPDLTKSELDRWVDLRLKRQQREDPPDLWVVLDEAVVRRPVGGRDVMRAQLRRLEEAGQTPRCTVQILPFEMGEHGCMGSAFILLEFADPADAPLAYIESRTSSVYLEEPSEVREYIKLFNHLRASAADTRRSLEIIADAAAGL
jgi:transcriptional regulator with XRE-family HTH domain